MTVGDLHVIQTNLGKHCHRKIGSAFIPRCARGAFSQNQGGTRLFFYPAIAWVSEAELERDVTALIAQHVTNTHKYEPELEVHFVNAYFNHLAEDMGVPERRDDFISIAKPEITANQLEECKRKVLGKFKPAALSRAMAEDYVDKVKGAVVDHIDKTKGAQQIDINGSFQDDQAADVFNKAKEMETILKSEFGEVSRNDYLLPDDDTFSSFHFARQPTLVAKHFMEELKKNGLVNYDDVISLAAGDNGEIKMLGDLFWRDNGGRCEELKAQELTAVSPQTILQKLNEDNVASGEHRAVLQGVVQHILDARESENIANVPEAWLKALADLLNQKQISKDEMVPVVMLAAAFNGTNALKTLIEVGANIDVKNEQGHTAAMHAAQNGYAGALKALIEAGVDLNFKGPQDVTLVMLAAENGRADALDVLLNVKEIQVTFVSGRIGRTKIEADLNATNKEGLTATMLAARNGHAGILEALLKAGVDVNAIDNESNTLAMLAAGNGHADALKVLLKAGADLSAINKKGSTAAILAAQNGHADGVEVIKVAEAIKAANTAAMHAAQNGDADKLRALIDDGLDIDLKGPYNETLAMLAAKKGHVSVLEVLIEAKADLNAINEGGATAAILATVNKNVDALKALIRAGADLNVANRGGFTAEKLATRFRYQEVLDTIKEAKNQGLKEAAEVQAAPTSSAAAKLAARLENARGRNQDRATGTLTPKAIAEAKQSALTDPNANPAARPPESSRTDEANPGKSLLERAI